MINEQKDKFADGKICGLTNKQAAIYAGYSEHTAASQGSRLGACPEVRMHIAVKKHLIDKGEAAMPDIAKPRTQATPQPAKPVTKTAPEAKTTGRRPLTAENRAERAAELREMERKAQGQIDSEAVFSSPEEYLHYIMNDPTVVTKDRIAAARALMSKENAEAKGRGKKGIAADKARAAASSSRFAAPAPPALVVNNGGKS